MAKIGEAELKAHLKNNSFSNAYLIYGDEAYLKEFYISQLKTKIVDPTFESFNLHQYDGKDVDLDDVFKDAEMLPMMSAYNLVLVRNYPADKSKSDVDAIKEFLKDVPESTIFILTYESIEPVKDKKNNNFNNLVKAFDKAGSAVNLQKRTTSEVARMLVSGAKKRKALLDISNANYLISVCGNDLKTLLNELDKLANFVNGNEITKQIIDDMATKGVEAKIFDLSKAVSAGKSDLAFSILDSLLFMKEEPIRLVSTIGDVYVDMYRVKCAKTAGLHYKEVGDTFNYGGREFVLQNAARDCAKLTEKQLRNSLDAILDTDIKLKSTSIDSKILIEELIAKLLLISQEDVYA